MSAHYEYWLHIIVTAVVIISLKLVLLPIDTYMIHQNWPNRSILLGFLDTLIQLVLPLLQVLSEDWPNVEKDISGLNFTNMLTIREDFHNLPSHDRKCPVLEFYHPAQLRGNLDLEVPENPETLAQILNDVKETARFCVKSGKKDFSNPATFLKN